MRGVDHHYDEEGGGGYSTKLFAGRLRPDIHPVPFLFIYHPFVYLLVINSTPSTYPV